MTQITRTDNSAWSFSQKFLFRFFFILCALLIVPILADLFWPELIALVGSTINHETVVSHPSGSGDTLYNFYQVIIGLVLAVFGACIWSLVDRKRASYNTLLYWQTVYVRYYLVFFMIVYGMSKVIKLQFAKPYLSALLMPLGQKSPMGLAWTFMGYSDTYTIFSGVCEVLAAVFLMFRKTRTLGGIMCFGVMLNVFLMNMSYDIPVKLFSFQLMVLAVFIAGQDYKRLIGFFILNQPIVPQANREPFKKKWANTTVTIAKIVIIVAAFGITAYNNLESQTQYGDATPEPPLYGIYEVTDFVRNSDTLAPVLSDTIRWRYIVFDKGDMASTFGMKANSYRDIEYWKVKTDTLKKEVAFYSYRDTAVVGRLKYAKTDSATYTFKGMFKKDTIGVQTLRTDENDFLLMNRGFHWVNEYPYNR